MTYNKRIISLMLAFIIIFMPIADVVALGGSIELDGKTDQERVEKAVKTLEDKWHSFNLDSDNDKNIVDVLKEDLSRYGFDDIEVNLKSSSNEKYIDNEGNISYYFEDPKTNGSPSTIQIECVFELRKGKARGEYKKNVFIGWDKEKVRKAIEKDIFPLIDEENIKNENKSLLEVKSDLLLENRPDKPNNYVSIEWESSNTDRMIIEKDSGLEAFYKPYLGKVTRGVKDEEVNLKARIKFNHTSGKDRVELEREYKLLVKGQTDNNLDDMQKLLDDNYTLDKLNYSGTNTPIDKDKVVGDIQLLTLRNAGIKGNYQLSASSDSEYIDVSGYRVNIFRPMGDEDAEATIKINMKDRNTNLSVEKDLKIRIAAFDKEELEADLALMEMAKENYFEAIRGNNIDEKEIFDNLKSFNEIYLEDGELKVAYSKNDMKNRGVVADAIDGWESQERSRAFKSSNPSVISHENLLVKRQDEDVLVKLESSLSIEKYKKYAEKYPDNETFKKLYKEPVSVELKVLNKNTLPQKTSVNREIEFLKEVYRAKLERGNENNLKISKQGAAAARFAGLDRDAIEKAIYIDDKNKTAFQLAQSIFTLSGAGLNPREYRDKTGLRDLVSELENMQMATGEFASTEREKNNLLFQLRSIIALDMVGGDYDEEKAVERLIELYNRRGEEGVINNKLLEAEGLMLIALSNHKDKADVDKTIKEILELLKEKQNPQGGFDMRNGSSKGKNTPLAIGRIIQGLISMGIDPLTDEEWIKDGNTMLDAMVRSKISHKSEMKYNGYGRGEEEKDSYGEATDIAFGALMDLKNQKSIFHLIKEENSIKTPPKNIEILNKEINSLEENSSLFLKTRVSGEKGEELANQNLEWSSSDSEVAQVDKGNVSGNKPGKATIGVRIKDTDIEDRIDIVVEKEKTIEVNTAIVYFDRDGEWHIESKPSKINLSKDEEGRYTAYRALEKIAKSFKGNETWISEINGIAGPEDTGGWTFLINDSMGNDLIGEAELKDGDTLLFSSLYDYKNNKKITWAEVLEKAGEEDEPAQALYSINILNHIREYKVGDKLVVDVEVLKDKVRVDEEYILSTSDESLASIDKDNNIIFKKEGNVTISVSLKEDRDVKTSVELKVVEDKLTVDKTINILRDHYQGKSDFTPREVMGYRYTSEDLDKDLGIISSKKKLRDNSSVADLSLNIISLISSGNNPYDYNGMDYVDLLLKSQKDNHKFIIKPNDDYETIQAFAVIALDMAQANYNKEASIKMLLDYQNPNGSFGGWEGLDSTGMVLTALGNHMDKEDVRSAGDKAVEYIKNNWKGENQYSLSAGIQGLVAFGVDLEGEGFAGIVDSLLSYYKDENIFGNAMANEQVFLALADISKGKSIYGEIRFNSNPLHSLEIVKLDRDIVVGDVVAFDIVARDINGARVPTGNIKWSVNNDKAVLTGAGKIKAIKPGLVRLKAQREGMAITSEIELEIKEALIDIEYIGDRQASRNKDFLGKLRVENRKNSDEKIVLIIAIYDLDNNLVDYEIVEETIAKKSKKDIEAKITIRNGERLKVFVWDSMEEQNILMKDREEFEIAK